MKRLFSSLLAALVLCSALAGCTPNAQNSLPSSAPQPAPGPSSTPLTESDIYRIYDEAAQVYNWFDLHPLPCTGDPVEVDGKSYRKVDYPGLKTHADLEKMVRAFFSTPLADQLLNTSQYRDIHGKLFCTEGSRGSDLFLDAQTVHVEHPDQDHWNVELQFWTDTAEGSVCTVGYSECVLHYELTDEGFRFTNFCPSDALDLNADTIHTIDVEADFNSGAYRNYTDWQLLCYLLHADGVYAEGPTDLLLRRFMERPKDVIRQLALLDASPFHGSGYSATDAILTSPGSSAAAWLSPEEQKKFVDVVSTCKPESDREQQILEHIWQAYNSALNQP